MTHWITHEGQTVVLTSKEGLVTHAPQAPWAVGRFTVAVLNHFRLHGARIDWATRA